MVNIAIIDQNKFVLMGLKQILKKTKNMQLVLESKTGEHFLENYSKHSIDVVIVEICSYGTKEKRMLEILVDIRQALPDVKVLVFTFLSFQVVIEECLKLQVEGFLLKRQGVEYIVEAIKTIASDGWFLSDSAVAVLSENRKLFQDKAQKLTLHEVDIVQEYLKGLTSKEVCDTLGISYGTLKSRKSSIYQKLHVKSLDQMIRNVILLKYIDYTYMSSVEEIIMQRPGLKMKEVPKEGNYKGFKSPYK